ncbi:MAG: hypothetical protein EOO85_28390 [Pedobacter sp.]|nr:MAG: hypothetical protein EOO85_28390 [Pedobacter sp.]
MIKLKTLKSDSDMQSSGYIIVCFFVLILLGCERQTDEGIKITVENNTSLPIHDLEIGTTEELDTIKILKLNPKEEIDSVLLMEENKLDGSYTIKFTRSDNQKEQIKRGYYTNGAPLEKSMLIDIQSDTTIITFGSVTY